MNPLNPSSGAIITGDRPRMLVMSSVLRSAWTGTSTSWASRAGSTS